MTPETLDLLKYGTSVIAIVGVVYHFGRKLGIIGEKLESIEKILYMAVGEIKDDVKELEEDIEETSRRVTRVELKVEAKCA
jgi:hypothetical protein